MIISVPKETFEGERRVALTPDALSLLKKAQMDVWVEAGAGERAGYPDKAYSDKGAQIKTNYGELIAKADIVVCVRMGGAHSTKVSDQFKGVPKDQVWVGFCEPLSCPECVSEVAKTGVRAFSIELLPRITRAQSMDALSSMATVAGYKAVLIAAHTAPRMFPLLMTAAGTVSPVHALIIGAGVAGLQAIATAKRLGAVVCAYDIRPVVKEQCESLGAKFVDLGLDTGDSQDKGGYAKAMGEDFYREQRKRLGKVISEQQVIISTAAVPGKKAPILITREMVVGMSPGAVIVDLAAERGGNCELTEPGKTVLKEGVTIVGTLNLPASIPFHASQMYSRNITSFLKLLVKEGRVELNLDDEILKSTLLTQGSEVVNPQVKSLLG